MAGTFSVDTDGLDQVIVHLSATEAALGQLAIDIDQRVAALQQEWSGLAADAQAAAHQEWASGLATMREALGLLRKAGRAAENAYRGAATANLALWQQVVP